MLRGIKSTQRKIRQIELTIDGGAGGVNGSIMAYLGGPASNQVKVARCNGGDIVFIELKVPFAAAAVVIGSGITDVKLGHKGGSDADDDEIEFTVAVRSEPVHLLLIGSDVDSKV